MKNKQFKTILRCYEEILKFLNEDDYSLDKITVVMNLLAAYKNSDLRNKELEEGLINIASEIAVSFLEKKDYERVRKCSNLIGYLLFKSEH